MLPLPKLTLFILPADMQLFSLNEEMLPASVGPLFSIRCLAVTFWSVAKWDGSKTLLTLEPSLGLHEFRKSKAFSQFLRFLNKLWRLYALFSVSHAVGKFCDRCGFDNCGGTWLLLLNARYEARLHFITHRRGLVSHRPLS